MQTKHYFQELFPERNSKRLQSPSLVYTSQNDEGNEGGLEFGRLFAAIRRRTLVVIGVTTAITSTAVAIALTSTPIYEAKFDLLTQPITVENKLLSSVPESLNDGSTKENFTQIENQTQQIFVLLSPKLMNPILQQIEAQYPSKEVPEIKISPVNATNILEVTYQDSNPEKVQFVLELVAQAYLKYSLNERQKDVRQGMQFVEAQLPKLQQRVETLQEQVQKFRQKHDIIDPAGQGQQLSSQLSAIVQQRVETQTQLAKTRALYIAVKKQLQLRSNEATAAAALSEAPRYQVLLNQLQEIQTKIAVESARYQEDSPLIQSLRFQEQNLVALISKAKQDILGKDSLSTVGKLQALASPNSIRSQLTQQFLETARQIQVLESQDKALAQTESLFRQQVKQFPVLARQNDDLERQLKIAVENLNQFLTKREALRIDAAQKQVPWQLLTPPTKPQPSTVSVKRNLVLGMFLGLLLGVGAALLVDKFNNLIYVTEEIKDTTRLPLLGEIPLIHKSQQFPVVAAGVTGLIQIIGNQLRLSQRGRLAQEQNISQFGEALRSVYTNIRFLSFDTPVRSLAIISASTEDGRSTIALHLAQTAAVMGQRVLLVDADLRNPKIHTMLSLPNTKGLSNVIVTELNFQDVLHQVNCVSLTAQESVDEIGELPWKDDFFVLTAGQVPPNPISLLSSQKMQNLARQFEAAFDLVIYDTSPLLGLADSNILATHTDASILVVGVGKTHRFTLEKALEGLKFSATPVMGVVANGVKE